MRAAAALAVVLALAPVAPAQDAGAGGEAPLLELGLGVPGVLEEVVLPGPELAVRPLDRDAPLVLRIVAVRPHGTAHRYDLEVYGLEGGDYDLRQLLVPAEAGAAPVELPPLPVTITDALPPGQVEPFPLEAGALPEVGGYRLALVLGAGAWIAGLLAILLVGRRRRLDAAAAAATGPSLAERLRPLVDEAAAGRLDAEGQARLERLLVGAWRRRLGLAGAPPAEALARLREHPEAGALLRALEAWLHQPPGRAAPVDVEALLAPYRDPAFAPDADAAAEEATPAP